MAKNPLERICSKLRCAAEETSGEFDVTYVGLVGSRCVLNRGTDWDLIVCTKKEPPTPILIHNGDISQLVLAAEWLKYETHEKHPTGLIPSILFKCIEMSRPIAGNMPSTDTISVQPADFINCGIKLERYRGKDEKNYLVSIIFMHILSENRLESFCFDNLELAERLGLTDIQNSLGEHYSRIQWDFLNERFK